MQKYKQKKLDKNNNNKKKKMEKTRRSTTLGKHFLSSQSHN